MRQNFTKVTKTQAMRALSELNLEVFVKVDGEIVPFDGSYDEIMYESDIYLLTDDLELMDD